MQDSSHEQNELKQIEGQLAKSQAVIVVAETSGFPIWRTILWMHQLWLKSCIGDSLNHPPSTYILRV